MSPGPNRPRPPVDGGRSSQNADRDRSQLPAVLESVRADAAAMAGTVPEFQMVVQLCGDDSYDRWSRGWQRAWIDVGDVVADVQWPDVLPAGHVAGLLIPVPAGRVGRALKRHPTPVVDPLLAHTLLPPAVTARDFALNLIINWIGLRQPGQGAHLAPPVLEFVRGGRVSNREVQDYGQTWDLPVADGV